MFVVGYLLLIACDPRKEKKHGLVGSPGKAFRIRVQLSSFLFFDVLEIR